MRAKNRQKRGSLPRNLEAAHAAQICPVPSIAQPCSGARAIALLAIADIVMEKSCCRRARSRDQRRRICGYSRYAETPRHLIVELSADGADYLAGTDAAGTPLVKTWDEIHYILDHARDKLSLRQILERWHNEEQDPPAARRYRVG